MNNIKERKPTVQTIVKEKYQSEEFEAVTRLDGEPSKFEVNGQTVEMSYEDRNVYYNFNESPEGWLDGEKAIELGTLLIEQGKKALLANMINHQLIHCISIYERYCKEDRVKQVILEMIDDTPVNYGKGFKTFLITPIWKQNKAPEYNEEFCFEDVIYFSPFEDEFENQINKFIVPVLFINYDHKKEVQKFNERCKSLK